MCQSKRYYRGVADRKAPCYINTLGRAARWDHKSNREHCDMKKLRVLIVVGIGTAFTALVGFVIQGWCSGYLKAETFFCLSPKG